MKKLLVILLCLALLLCGCGAKEPEYDGLMEYPGLQWGMTFEEVQAVLGFTDGDILESKQEELDPERPTMPAYHKYTVENVEIFGFPTAQVILRFHEYTGHAPGLAEMVVYFPDGYEGSQTTDVDALRRVVEEHYGERVMAVPSVRWDYDSGELVRREHLFDGDDVRYWVSGTTVRDHLNEAELELLYAAATDDRKKSDNIPTFDQFCQSQENPAATLELKIDTDEEAFATLRESGMTGLRLFFDGKQIVHALAVDRFSE